MQSEIRVVIVEDNTLSGENLRSLLSEEPGLKVVGLFESAEDALFSLKEVFPHIMIVDLVLPGMSGIDMIGNAKKSLPDVEILAHTICEDRDHLFSALKAGASGYILKGSSSREIIGSIYNLYNGGAPMSPKIARKIIKEFQDEIIFSDDYQFSFREKEILKNVEDGLTYREISKILNISPHTVHTHIKNIYEKLHANCRQDALLKARRKGLI